MTEYAVVVTLAALVLIWSGLGTPSPIQRLMSAIKSFYSAFSYVLSVAA